MGVYLVEALHPKSCNAPTAGSIIRFRARARYLFVFGVGESRRMSVRDAITAAQSELSALGASGTVVDVRRTGRDVLIVLDDHSSIKVGGYLAVKLRKMLTSQYLRWRKPSS